MKLNYLLLISVVFFAGCGGFQKMEWKPLGVSVFTITDGVISLESGTLVYRGSGASKGFTDFEMSGFAKTEPDVPFRTAEYQNRMLGKGNFLLVGYQGKVDFKDITITRLSSDTFDVEDFPEAVDERTDPVIRLQQRNFPLIDYHVHLDYLTMEQAHALSMLYGINYGIAPNCGIGHPITNDEVVRAFVNSTQHLPFYAK